MSAFVLHDGNGLAASIATGVPPIPVPLDLTAKVITDAEFVGLTTGTHRWDAPTRTVQVDAAKTAAATNQQAVIDALVASMATMQAIINTAQVAFTTTAAAQTAMRTLQQQIKDEALVLRRLIRVAVGDFSGTS